MCGQSGSGHGGTAGLGCFTCAKGRFVKKTPYTADAEDLTEFITPEINVIVGDICPYGSNAQWCRGKAGAKNAVGLKNHLDFSRPPAGVDNNYFVFSPSTCSAELRVRARKLMKVPCGGLASEQLRR